MNAASRSRVLAGFAVLTLVWGTTWAAIRVGLAGVPPFTGVALRFSLAGGLLFALARRLGVPLGRGGRREWLLWLSNGVLSFCISYAVVYWSEQYIPSGLAAVLFATHPLFVAVIAHFVLPGERLRASTVGGLAFGFAGVALIFSDDLRLLGGGHVRDAALVMLLSPLASAVSGVLIKRWGAELHPLSLAAVPMLLCGAVMTPVALVVERGVPVVLDLRSTSALLYLAVFGSALTFTVYYWILARVSATAVALSSYLIPIVAVAVGVLLFDEPLRPRLVAGSALVLAGVGGVSLLRARAARR